MHFVALVAATPIIYNPVVWALIHLTIVQLPSSDNNHRTMSYYVTMPPSPTSQTHRVNFKLKRSMFWDYVFPLFSDLSVDQLEDSMSAISTTDSCYISVEVNRQRWNLSIASGHMKFPCYEFHLPICFLHEQCLFLHFVYNG